MKTTSKAILMALLALPLAVLGRVVSSTEAVSAARAWAREGAHLGAQVGATVSSVAAQQTTNDAPFFVVKFRNGGTVFTSGDTEVSPIIAFTAATNDFSNLDPNSPLWALLNRDLSSRTRTRAQSGAQNARTLSAVSSSAALAAAETLQESTNANERAWGELLAKDAQPGYRLAAASSRSSVGDTCVDTLVESRWSQSTHNDSRSGFATYNFCTPQTNEPFANGTYTVTNDAAHNAVCGCVATAMSQLMRYHKYPDASHPVTNNLTHACWFGTNQFDLTMQGGVYDWDSMDFVPKTAFTDADASLAHRRAIGKITSDAGISVEMQYTLNDSGTFLSLVPGALCDTFHFAQAYYYNLGWDSTTKSKDVPDTDVLNTAVFANLDAGFPVLFGITSKTGGHAIVGDGYGYDSNRPYVHLNMGWSGSEDLWYNLPNIGTGYEFNAVDEVVFNAIPNDADGAILSGRVRDVAGNVAPGATVKVSQTGSLVAQTTTSLSGIFSFVLPEGAYVVEISYANNGAQSAKRSVSLVKPSTSSLEASCTYPNGDEGSLNVAYVPGVDRVNNYREEIALDWTYAVRLDGEESKQYGTLDEGLAAAAADGNAHEILVFHPTSLTNSFTIAQSITISASATDYVVTRSSGAQLKVANGGTLTLHDVRFAAKDSSDDSYLVDVASNGVVKVGGGLRLPGGVHTADEKGFRVYAALTASILLTCDGHMGLGDTAGYVLTDDAAVANTLNLVLNAEDDDLGGVKGESDGSGKWCVTWSDGTDVADGDAVVKLNGVNRRSFDNALKRLVAGSDATITLLQNATMSRSVALSSTLTIASASLRTVTVAPEAGFTVNAGGALDLSYVRFDGQYENRDTFVKVNGGALTLGDYAQIYYMNGTNHASGAIFGLNDAYVKMSGSNAKIYNCQNLQSFAKSGKSGSRSVGGGMTLAGAVADLSSGSISGCSAPTAGGAIYAAYPSKVYISGSIKISGNYSGEIYGSTDAEDDDVGCDEIDVLVVTNTFTGSVGVSVESPVTGYGSADQAGVPFAVVAANMSDDDATAAASHFFNSKNDDLQGVYNKDARTLAWGEAAETSKQCPEASAAVKVVYDANPASPEWYANLETAIACLTNAATVSLLRSTTFEDDMVVAYDVLLMAKDRDAAVLCRANSGVSISLGGGGASDSSSYTIEVAEGAKLVVSNLVIDCTNDATITAAPLLFYVNGGELTFENGTLVKNVKGGKSLASGAVGVAGGTFTMKDGSEINYCRNTYQAGYSGHVLNVQKAGGGAVRVGDRGTFNFHGGTITGCRADDVGGVAINNESTMRVKGDARLYNNYLLDGSTLANLTVSDDSVFELEAPLKATTAQIGVMPPVDSDLSGAATNVAATVSGDLDLADAQTFTNVAQSAACFYRDTDAARGVVATNALGRAWVVFTNGVEDVSLLPWIPCARQMAVAVSDPSGLVLDGLPTLAIQSFTYDAASGDVSITATNAAARAYYSLWWNGQPNGDFTYVEGSETNGVDGPVTFRTVKPAEAGDGAIFWKVLITGKPQEVLE